MGWIPVKLGSSVVVHENGWVHCPANHALWKMAHSGDKVEWEAWDGSSRIRRVEPYTVGEK